MAQIQVIRKDDDKSFINPTSEGYYSGATHLELDLVDVSSTGISNFNFWIERSVDQNPPSEYQKGTEMKNNEGYDVLIDGVKEINLKFLDENNEIISNGLFEKSFDGNAHSIIVDINDFGYNTLWKYGNYTFIGDQIFIGDPVSGRTFDLMENPSSVFALITGKVNLNKPHTLVFTSNDDGYKEMYVAPNTGDTPLEITIDYTCYFDNDTDIELFSLHLIQNVFKSIELTLTISGDASYEKLCLPLTAYYSTFGTDNTMWYKFLLQNLTGTTPFNITSSPLKIPASEVCNKINVYLDDDDVYYDSNEMGNPQNILRTNIITTNAKNGNLAKLNFNEFAKTGKESVNPIKIKCTITAANATKHHAKIVKSYNPETGEIVYYTDTEVKNENYFPDFPDFPDYYTITEYNAAFTVIKNSLRSETDDSYNLSVDAAITAAQSFVNSLSNLKTDIRGVDNTLVLLPFVNEETSSVYIENFGIKNLQIIGNDEAYSDLNYKLSFDGVDTIYTPSTPSDVILFAPSITIEDDGLKKDEANNFDTSIVDGNNIDKEFYVLQSPIKKNLTIEADFTGTNSTLTKGNITYSPLVYNLTHAAGFEREFNKDFIEETLYPVPTNTEFKDYNAFRYQLKTEEETTTLGIAVPELSISNKVTITKHKTEKSVVNYFVRSIAKDSNFRIPAFDLELECDPNLPPSIVWDGSKEDLVPDIPVDPNPPEDYKEVYAQVRVSDDYVGKATIESGAIRTSTNTKNYARVLIPKNTDFTIEAINIDDSSYEFYYWENDESNEKFTDSSVTRTANKNYSFTAYYLVSGSEMPPIESDEVYVQVKIFIDNIGSVSVEGSGETASTTTTVYAKITIPKDSSFTITAIDVEGTMYIFDHWENDDSGERIETSAYTGVADQNYSFTAYYNLNMICCDCDLTVVSSIEVTENPYRIVPGDKVDNVEYLYVLKNTTGTDLVVYYESYSTSDATMIIPVDQFGEVSMLYNKDIDKWISRGAVF